MNDPIVFDGFMMKLRGVFVDKLMVADLERFQKLKVMLRNNEFKKWFQKPITNDKLKSQLSNKNFYGIESSTIKNNIDLSLKEASVNLKEIYWEQIGKAFRKLTDRSQQLLNGGFNTETLTFKIEWEEDYFRRSWYAPNSEELWAKYGIPVDDLQN
ncbi:hypothetical protein [Chondrinema litorale]|uniref:hypothetical protein n=1 Tax=Chondrinema litorale TaxID=2994555 RepID=UPI002543CD4F|nr:hypothetical protein [Chondrinema litorale]UZR96380.1 hypothetical protein OQ292_22245 [Chondrinema litorale]